MLNLFLDANIWLDLYHFSQDDLRQFSRLADMINKDVKLFVTTQLHDEVSRNRENKIKDAYTQFKKFNLEIPNLCKGYTQFQTLKRLIKDLKEVHSNLCDAINADIDKEMLHADKIIKQLFEDAENVDTDATIIERAKERFDLGNPPGKNRSYGDAINWEALLQYVPPDEDLFFVSADKDYRSPVNDSRLSTFLANEWKSKKSSRVFFYPSLTTFLAKHISDIRLKSEQEKNGLIKTLSVSGNFAATHSLISELIQFESFTDDQLEQLMEAADTNSQVGGIIRDSDLYAFYRKILHDRLELFTNNTRFTHLLRELNLIPSDEDGVDV